MNAMRKRTKYPLETRTWLIGCCLSLQAITPACQRSKRASGVTQSKPSDAGQIATDAPDARLAASSGSNPYECGLRRPQHIDLIPMVRNRLVISRTLRTTKLVGTPRLVVEPNSFENYYLAESSFAAESLPSQVLGLRGASVSFVNAPQCRAKVGTFFAWAWANEQGSGWKPGNAPFDSMRAFRDGDSFLVAELENDCANQKELAGATGSLPAHFHAWQVSDLSEQARTEETIRLMKKGLVALESEPALSVSNDAYARFRSQVPRVLPDHWWFLPHTFARWSLATDGDAGLLILELQTRDVVESQEFSAAWLGLWCIGSGGRLESLGLDFLPHQLWDTVGHRSRLQVASAPGDMPVILYSHYSLQANTGQYRTYEYALPAPVRLD